MLLAFDTAAGGNVEDEAKSSVLRNSEKSLSELCVIDDGGERKDTGLSTSMVMVKEKEM